MFSDHSLEVIIENLNQILKKVKPISQVILDCPKNTFSKNPFYSVKSGVLVSV